MTSNLKVGKNMAEKLTRQMKRHLGSFLSDKHKNMTGFLASEVGTVESSKTSPSQHQNSNPQTSYSSRNDSD